MLLFNGEDDHKVPSTSRALLDGDLFRVVGRMIGHKFINEGPLYSGLSQAFFPLLSGSKDETPVLELKDCPDTDVIEVVSLVCIYIYIYCGGRSKRQTQWAWRQASERLLLNRNNKTKCPKGIKCPK